MGHRDPIVERDEKKQPHETTQHFPKLPANKLPVAGYDWTITEELPKGIVMQEDAQLSSTPS